MKTAHCVPQRISKYLLSSLFAIAALGLIIIGITLLPFLGIILAMPVLALAIYIFQTRLNDQCEIDFDAH